MKLRVCGKGSCQRLLRVPSEAILALKPHSSRGCPSLPADESKFPNPRWGSRISSQIRRIVLEVALVLVRSSSHKDKDWVLSKTFYSSQPPTIHLSNIYLWDKEARILMELAQQVVHLHPWNNPSNHPGRLGEAGGGPDVRKMFYFREEDTTTGRLAFCQEGHSLCWLDLHLISKARYDFLGKPLLPERRGTGAMIRWPVEVVAHFKPLLTNDCWLWGVVGTNKQKGRGMVLQASFPVQTAPLGIQSPQHLPPPTSKTGPSWGILRALPPGTSVLSPWHCHLEAS